MGANSLTSNNASGSKMRIRPEGSERSSRDSNARSQWQQTSYPYLWVVGEAHGATGSISGGLPFDQAIEKLKAQYEFVQADEIFRFLRHYPFLIADLNRIYEIKSRYFDVSPMDLYYISETGSLESATLAAYIKISIPRKEAKEIFSRFDEEWWENISKEAKTLLMVDIVKDV